ncbi:(2Fe-2S)-binding protein [Sulfuricurvum sp.]|uniref:(2Fe-2S)-binding protein n=1 Tax=Sulfuricurvum sp. TaxID=2025608 RepID=UPI00260B43FD|nr:(2Fe-2S)-binding protein [Sulfuricurvum sp.]MDD2267318.1 (2Fe-2S)-binding protein [Sulfuricurvum sp.]MDD2783940.1 (2Fe-2S)-binding protein [Sulfuricurvum sp.]
MAIQLKIDDRTYSVDADPDTPLLWILRDYLNLTGTKFGCGVAQCGTCTVLMDGSAIRSCVTPLSSIGNAEITTIQNQTDPLLKKVQEAWIDNDVIQCGYCQPGQIMNAVGLLKSNPHPSEEEIINAMDGNICRCGTYNRIKAAILAVSQGE